MTNYTTGRWLLVALALVGLVFAAPVVSAHGGETNGDDATADDAAADWAAWMEAQMTEHMGPGAVEWMESHMGVTVGEMAQDMADGDHDRGMYGGGMYGQGHC